MYPKQELLLLNIANALRSPKPIYRKDRDVRATGEKNPAESHTDVARTRFGMGKVVWAAGFLSLQGREVLLSLIPLIAREAASVLPVQIGHLQLLLSANRSAMMIRLEAPVAAQRFCPCN